MGFEDTSWGAAGWVAMSLMMLAFWGLFIGLVVWAVHSFRAGSDSVHPQDGGGRADEIFAERYARGDIDEIEYQRRRGLIHTPGQ